MMEVLHSKPWLNNDDIAAVTLVLRSGMVGQGRITAEFERTFADWLGCEPSGVAVGTGAAAILLALQALECGPGAEVILPTYNCPTVLEAVVASGATPRLFDAGRDWIIDATQVASLVNAHTRAIIIPHLYGIKTDLTPITALGIPVIEDCAQWLGAPGAYRIEGTIAVFSFQPTKCLTTGEGGLALTPGSTLAAKLRQLRDGTPNFALRRTFSPMPDTAAALGLSQLKRYNEMLTRRARIATCYADALASVLPESIAWLRAAPTMFYRFPIRIAGGLERYQAAFYAEGIHVRRGVDRLLHRWLGQPDSAFPGALRLFAETVSLPIYPALTDDELAYCTHTAVKVLARA